MMEMEKILNLNEYEIASILTIQEMKNVVESINSKLSNILAIHNSKWFSSKLNTLNSLQAAVLSHISQRDSLIEQYKISHPEQVNRFILEITEVEFIYALQLMGEKYRNNLESAIVETFDTEGKRIMIKKCETVNEINDKIENKKNDMYIDNKEQTEEEKDIESIALLTKELKLLREEIKELRKQVE